MSYHLLDKRPVTLGEAGLTVWAEGGWQLTIRSKKTFYTVADQQGRVYLVNEEWRLRVSKETFGATRRVDFFIGLTRNGSPLFYIHPMLRIKSVLKALR